MESDSNNQNPWSDLNRTTVLPHVDGFPITEDLPAVQVRKGGNWLRNLGLLLVVVVLACALALAANLLRDRQAGTAAEFPAAPAPTLAPAPQPSASTVVVVSGEPGFWMVVGVEGGLNVRSGPGTTNDIVGTLAAGQRHVFATGERAESGDGGQWMQITLDDSDEAGWVSARFLASDTAPPQGEPRATVSPATGSGSANTSTVCFASSGSSLVARIGFTNRVELSGELLTGSVESGLLQQVSGTLANGQALVSLSDLDSENVTQQQWTFNPANVDLGDGTSMAVVDCSTISLN